MPVMVDVSSCFAGVNCFLMLSRFAEEMFTSMRFLFAGYAIAAAFELVIWHFGFQQSAIAVALQVWIGGALLGLSFAWSWFQQSDSNEDLKEERSVDAPLLRPQAPVSRGMSVARDIH